MAKPSKADRHAAERIWERLCVLRERWMDLTDRAFAGERVDDPLWERGYGTPSVNMIAAELMRVRKRRGAPERVWVEATPLPPAAAACRCGNPAQPPHACPYKEEIHDCVETCTCCDACQRMCAGDI